MIYTEKGLDEWGRLLSEEMQRVRRQQAEQVLLKCHAVLRNPQNEGSDACCVG